MTERIIPVVGASGVFSLRAPFDVLVTEGERYTCQAVRRISEYLANNEDPETSIYSEYGIAGDWQDHLKLDMDIVSIQSEKGHWLYIPATYINAYPDINGIPYRAMGMVVALPSLPADTNLSGLMVSIQSLVTDQLGVASTVTQVELSRPVQVPRDTHDLKVAERQLVANQELTDYARLQKALSDNADLLMKVSELEQYILDNHV